MDYISMAFSYKEQVGIGMKEKSKNQQRENYGMKCQLYGK